MLAQKSGDVMDILNIRNTDYELLLKRAKDPLEAKVAIAMYSDKELENIFTILAEPIWEFLTKITCKTDKSSSPKMPVIHVCSDGRCPLEKRKFRKYNLAHTHWAERRDIFGHEVKYAYDSVSETRTKPVRQIYQSPRRKAWVSMPVDEPTEVIAHICIKRPNGITLRVLIHELTHARGFKHKMLQGLKFSKYDGQDRWSEYLMETIFPQSIKAEQGPI